jgi:hypothetical protein
MRKNSKQTLRDILGIKAGMRIYMQHVPADVLHELRDLEDSTSTVHDPALANFFLYFVSTKPQLFNIAEKLQHLGAPSQLIWVCWPKKVSSSSHHVIDQDLRDALLPIGLVDSRRFDISKHHAAMKFVWRQMQ